jgi:NAD(P)-dependent dehydrogenase (short-subunit alcohol dehydrogenase family)
MLANEPDKLLEFNLEITDEAQIHAMVAVLSEIKIDVLFVNAGIGRGAGDRVDTMTRSDFVELLVTNALSPIVAIDSFRPLMKEDGVVVVMSSNLASIANNTDGGGKRSLPCDLPYGLRHHVIFGPAQVGRVA